MTIAGQCAVSVAETTRSPVKWKKQLWPRYVISLSFLWWNVGHSGSSSKAGPSKLLDNLPTFPALVPGNRGALGVDIKVDSIFHSTLKNYIKRLTSKTHRNFIFLKDERSWQIEHVNLWKMLILATNISPNGFTTQISISSSWFFKIAWKFWKKTLNVVLLKFPKIAKLNGTPELTSTGEWRDFDRSHVTWSGNASMESRLVIAYLQRRWNDKKVNSIRLKICSPIKY